MRVILREFLKNKFTMKILLVSFVLNLLAAVMDPWHMLVIKNSFEQMDEFWFYFFMTLGLFGGSLLINLISSLIFHYGKDHWVTSMLDEYGDALAEGDFTLFSDQSSPSIRQGGDLPHIAGQIMRIGMRIMCSLFKVGSAVIAISMISGWLISMVVFAVCLVATLIYKLLYKKTCEKSDEFRKAARERDKSILSMCDWLSVRLSFAQEYERDKHRELNHKTRKISTEKSIIAREMDLFQNSVVLLLVLGMMAIARYQILAGRFTAAAAIMIIDMVFVVFNPLQWIIEIMEFSSDCKTVAERFDAVINCPRRLRKGTIDLDTFSSFMISNANLHYDKMTECVRDVNLHVNTGEMIAVVGESGTGKSTIINAIAGVISSPENAITFDNVDINKFTTSSLLQMIVIVMQNPHVHEGTIEDNFFYGINKPREELLERLDEIDKRLNLHKFIPDFKKKITAGGHGLSGGQAQMVHIVRALLVGAKLIIMDEPTSSLDCNKKYMIRTLFAELKEMGCALIVITHDLVTVQDADRIYVLGHKDDGVPSTIIESGTHKELVDFGGVYSQMVMLQSFDYLG